MSRRFDGKTALISGGGTGIGAAVARRLTQEGARVILLGRRHAQLAAVAGAIGAEILVGDAADTSDAEEAVAMAVDRFGGLDVVVANAGGHGFATLAETSDDDWSAARRSNLDTAVVLLRAAMPELVRRKGVIAVTASIASLAAPASAFGYTVTKHAQIGLVRSIARDFGRQGVRCNAVCPGWVTTEMADAEMDELRARMNLSTREEAYALVTKDVPLGRSARPEDVAAAIAFICSSEPEFIKLAEVLHFLGPPGAGKSHLASGDESPAQRLAVQPRRVDRGPDQCRTRGAAWPRRYASTPASPC